MSTQVVPQESPRASKKHPSALKEHNGGHKEFPRSPWELPRRSQELPRSSQDLTRSSQEATRAPQEHHNSSRHLQEVPRASEASNQIHPQDSQPSSFQAAELPNLQASGLPSLRIQKLSDLQGSKPPSMKARGRRQRRSLQIRPLPLGKGRVRTSRGTSSDPIIDGGQKSLHGSRLSRRPPGWLFSTGVRLFL